MYRGSRCDGTASALLVLLAALAAACSSPTGPTPPPGTPLLTCPADMTAESPDGKPLAVLYQVPVASGGAAPVVVACAPPPGTAFSPGTTAVSCTGTDANSRLATCGFMVRVTTPRLTRTRFMAFGDSLTEGKAGPADVIYDVPGSYPSRLEQMLDTRYAMQSPVVTRRGWGGETTYVGLTTRFPGNLATDRPEVVLLLEGVNDISGGDPAAIAPALWNLRQMIQIARSSGALVYLANLPPEIQGRKRAGAYPLIPSFNQGIANLAAETGATPVDVFTPLSQNVSSYVDADGLHLTQAGYQKMAEVFFERIRATLETTALPSAAAPFSPFGVRRPEGMPRR